LVNNKKNSEQEMVIDGQNDYGLFPPFDFHQAKDTTFPFRGPGIRGRWNSSGNARRWRGLIGKERVVKRGIVVTGEKGKRVYEALKKGAKRNGKSGLAMLQLAN